MKNQKISLLIKKVTFLLFFFSAAEYLSAQVRVYEETEIIPTYKRGADETSPSFIPVGEFKGQRAKYILIRHRKALEVSW